jgi:hypothetical protein
MPDSKEFDQSKYGEPIFQPEEELQAHSQPARRGIHKNLNRIAGVAIGVASILAPGIATAALAEGAPSTPIEWSQNNQNIAFDNVGIRMADRTNFMSGWFLNEVGKPVNSDFLQYASDKTVDLGNGYTAYQYGSAVKGLESQVIVRGGKEVVFKSVIVAPLTKGDFTITDIPSLLGAKPLDPIPAPEYGQGMVRLSFPDRGLAVITQSTNDNWQVDSVFAVEGFLQTNNTDEYNAFPWIVADSQTQAIEQTQTDNPQ